MIREEQIREECVFFRQRSRFLQTKSVKTKLGKLQPSKPTLDSADGGVFLLVGRVVLAKHLHACPIGQCSGQHSAPSLKRSAVLQKRAPSEKPNVSNSQTPHLSSMNAFCNSDEQLLMRPFRSCARCNAIAKNSLAVGSQTQRLPACQVQQQKSFFKFTLFAAPC